MKIALAQINPCVGDISGNTKKIIELISRAKSQNADLVVFPELAITGYPPEDLVLKPQFVQDNINALKEIAGECRYVTVFLGFVDKKGNDICNAGAFISNGKIISVYHKMHLPNYAVFDEKRYFTPGKKPLVVTLKGEKIGFGICEDIWNDKGPFVEETKKGAKIIVNINASPFHIGKIREREKLLISRAKKQKAHIVYVNMVGGQDELVFDGGSMVIDPKGRIISLSKQFKEDLTIVDLDMKPEKSHFMGELEEVYNALTVGVADYVKKNGFSQVVIGLSGGIDSALTLAIAKDALGAENVRAVFMPSQYTISQSLTDAQTVAKNLGVEMKVIPIKETFDSYLKDLEASFYGSKPNIAEENLQARIRGNLLMALSNKFNWLVLTTGNKSEMSTGYCTLYGDMAGGFAVLKDVPKTLVYKLVEWRNKKGNIIPKSIIDRPPTAELKPNQKDQDTLPPYDLLDKIIKLYVEDNLSVEKIIKKGFDGEVVKKAISLIDHSEYKRRQSPPGPRITKRAFGKDWRLPITNRY